MKNGRFIGIGLVALGLCFSLGAATGAKITAELGKQKINLYGEEVYQEAINYKNTLYLPLRDFGTMLNAPISYKDGVVYVGKEIKNNTDGNWQRVDNGDQSGATITITNDQLKAVCHITSSELQDKSKTDAKAHLDEMLKDKDKMKEEGTELIKGWLEKTNGMDVILIESKAEKTMQLEAYAIYKDGRVVCGIMQKEDGSDPMSLKKELLAVIENVTSVIDANTIQK